MQTEEFVIITYGHISDALTRPLECPVCRQKSNLYVTSDTILEKVPLYCRRCKRTFKTDFKGNRQRSIISKSA